MKGHPLTSAPAPISVFAYRRTKTLAQALDALESCAEFSASRVFIFSDGPKDQKSARDVAMVRELARARLRPNMILVEREKNMGLAASIIDGVTSLCNEYGRVIVIEDDLIVAPGALAWLNFGLDGFSDDPNVWQVALHQWDVPEFARRSEGVFLNMTSSWGWATWKRAWDRFDPEAKGWRELAENPELRKRFDIGGIYPYSEMLQRAVTGAVDSWAVRFWWSVFRAHGVSLFPPRSLITNIGYDSLATNFRYGFWRGLLKRRCSASPMEAAPQVPSQSCAEAEEDREAISRAIGRSRHFGVWGNSRR
jgi:hypothetical protein